MRETCDINLPFPHKDSIELDQAQIKKYLSMSLDLHRSIRSLCGFVVKVFEHDMITEEQSTIFDTDILDVENMHDLTLRMIMLLETLRSEGFKCAELYFHEDVKPSDEPYIHFGEKNEGSNKQQRRKYPYVQIRLYKLEIRMEPATK